AGGIHCPQPSESVVPGAVLRRDDGGVQRFPDSSCATIVAAAAFEIRYTAPITSNTNGSARMHDRVFAKSVRDNVSDEQWQARVDLAAAHRLAYMHGFSEGIFNHLTLVVPGASDRYYQIPFGTHWSEVTASTFMEVGIDDSQVKSGEGD
ncbi:hypothetical protein KXV85_005219, partial [Aspergillus fumigatus]